MQVEALPQLGLPGHMLPRLTVAVVQGYFGRNINENNAINGLLAACVLSFVGVVAFGVMSLLVLAV